MGVKRKSDKDKKMTYLLQQLNPLWIHLPILALSIWRQSRIIRKETGPFAVIYRFRHLFKTYEGKCYDDGGIRELLSCNKCLSIYIGLANLAIYQFPLGQLWVYLFALSALCLYLETGDENWASHCEEISIWKECPKCGKRHAPAECRVS